MVPWKRVVCSHVRGRPLGGSPPPNLEPIDIQTFERPLRVEARVGASIHPMGSSHLNPGRTSFHHPNESQGKGHPTRERRFSPLDRRPRRRRGERQGKVSPPLQAQSGGGRDGLQGETTATELPEGFEKEEEGA